MPIDPVDAPGPGSWPDPDIDDDGWRAPDEAALVEAMRARFRFDPSPQPKRNHHYVPQFWLRQFTAPGRGGQRVIGRLDVHRGVYRELATKRVASVAELYDSPAAAGVLGDALENLFGIVEAAAAPVMEQLRAGRTPTASGRMALSTFLVMQGMRIPRHIEQAGRPAAAEWHDTVEGWLRIAEARGYDPEATATLRRYHDAGMSLDVGHLFHYQDLADLAAISAPRLVRRRWSVATAPSRVPLVLGDNPVPALPLGRCACELDDGRVELFPSLVPLSWSALLVIHDEPDDGTLVRESPTEAERLSGLSNHWQLRAAQRYLFESPTATAVLRQGAATNFSGRRRQ